MRHNRWTRPKQKVGREIRYKRDGSSPSTSATFDSSPRRDTIQKSVANGTVELLTKEVQILSEEVVEFDKRSQARYYNLIEENEYLKRKVEKLLREVSRLNAYLFPERIKSGGKGGQREANDGEKKFGNGVQKNETAEESDSGHNEKGEGAASNNTDQNSLITRKRRAATKNEGHYAKLLKGTLPVPAGGKEGAKDGSVLRAVKKEPDEKIYDSEGSSTDASVGSYNDRFVKFGPMRKPAVKDLSKPKTITVGLNRTVRYTDEWKEYAVVVYPIDPSLYWNIPQSDYDLLIPDEVLEHFDKDNAASEKGQLIRGIYDWFRCQHRVAQLRILLNECDDAGMDLDKLWTVYVKKMKQKGWPIYGRRLRRNEVTLARKQISENFQDNKHSQEV